MEFQLTEDQRMIEASAQDWLAGNHSFAQREERKRQPKESNKVWNDFAELGWLGLALREEVGGFGARPMEAGLLMQSFGESLVTEPFISAILQAARLIDLQGSEDQRSSLLPKVIDGTERLAYAHAESGVMSPWAPRNARATKTNSGWKIDGVKEGVEGAEAATLYVVTASCDDGSQRAFIVLPGASGLVADHYDTLDGYRAADLWLSGVEVDVDAVLGSGPADAGIARVASESLVAQCWEAAGAMKTVVAQTSAYTQQRKQFGRALSAFQVVQHRLAEMLVECTEAQASCELASMLLANSDGSCWTDAAMLKSRVSRAAEFVSKNAVQLHGAMGVCEELPVAATFRMLLAFQLKQGDGRRLAAQVGAEFLSSGAYAESATLGAAN